MLVFEFPREGVLLDKLDGDGLYFLFVHFLHLGLKLLDLILHPLLVFKKVH